MTHHGFELILRLLKVLRHFLEHTEIASQIPAVMFPERSATGVAPQQENVAFRNALFPQGPETTGNQRLTETLPAVCGHDGKVMEITASPIVSGENSGYNRAADGRHETQPRVPSQITGYSSPGITVIIQPDPRNAPPQRQHSLVISASHFSYGVFHPIPSKKLRGFV
jgi:hypothetical protein